jgi:hypothetical protein
VVVGVSPVFCSGRPPRRCQVLGRRGINAYFMRVFDGRMALVPEGQADRSQATISLFLRDKIHSTAESCYLSNQCEKQTE